jgi:hypothetical protein
VLPSGEKFKSVTTVLSQKLDKSGLVAWRKRVGEAEADRISAMAAARGTVIHRMAELYLRNDPLYLRGTTPFNADTFKSVAKILDKHVDDIYGLELPLFNRTLKTAGRTDAVAHWDGIPSIIDFKTSLRLKEEKWITGYFLQSTCYALMFSFMYKVPITQFVIVIAADHEPVQIFRKDIGPYVNKVIELFTQ